MNKGGLERLQQIQIKVSKIKQEAYEKITKGEIIGDSTSHDVHLIDISEINLDEKFKPQNTTQTDHAESTIIPMDDSDNDAEEPSEETNDKSEEVKENVQERESKSEFLSKTDISNISRPKEEVKIQITDEVYDADELEELKKLEEERNNDKKSKKNKNKRNKKKKNKKVVVTGNQIPDKPADEISDKLEKPNETPDSSKIEDNKPSISLSENSNTNEVPSQPIATVNAPPKISFAINDEDEEEKESPDSLPKDHEFSPHKGKLSLLYKLILELDTHIPVAKKSAKLGFAKMHEIHSEEFSEPYRAQFKEQCKAIKQTLKFDEDEETVDVVKDDDGEVYILKQSKENERPKSILKAKKVVQEDESDSRTTVFFNLQQNEIKDFTKNERIYITIDKLKKSKSTDDSEPKRKKGKKGKGKGKNRKMNDDQQKQKELEKIRKAEEKRREREELEDMVDNELQQNPFLDALEDEVDDEFGSDEDFEACNAPKSRKHNSEQLNLINSPFGEDSLSFSVGFNTAEDVSNSQVKKEISKPHSPKNSIVDSLDIPTKAAQVERDMRSLKNDINDQRDYLMRIDPNNLATIFKSSIEIENIMTIVKALSSGSTEWNLKHAEFLSKFIHKLTLLERFDMAINF